MPQITANGLTFAYDERGKGGPLLLVMGLGPQMIAWHETFMDQSSSSGSA